MADPALDNTSLKAMASVHVEAGAGGDSIGADGRALAQMDSLIRTGR